MSRLRNLLLDLHERESGMISLVSVVVLLFIVVLIGMVANVGYAINQKMEVQNSADAVAYTSGVWMARGMNVITTTNHLIGEMQALVVLHAAIGGEEMENKQPLDPQEAAQRKAELDAAAAELRIPWALLTGEYRPAYPNEGQKVGENVTDGATFRAGMIDLKKALTKVYWARVGAKVAKNSGFPPAMLIGGVVDGAAQGVEGIILLEYEALNLMRNAAKKAIWARDILWTRLLPGAADFEKFAVDNVPSFAAGAGKAIAEQNRTTGGVYPNEPPLPVLAEPRPDGDLEMRRSALVRTTYPWVIYDRTPMLRLMNWMIFSHARKHYVKYTDMYTRLKSKELYGTGFTMYVMTKRGEQKGNEPWTRDSRLADQKFTLVGFAHRQSKTVASSAVFGVPNRDGMVAAAQAIVYNANSQNPGSGGTFQPEVGWDTLNWQPPVSSSAAYEFPGPEESTTCPRIRINWQTKLTPVTRLGEAARSGVGGPFDSVLQRLGAGTGRWLTH